jgi:hypothetical protein
MEAVSLILAALAAGALAAVKDTAAQTVKDAYASLKSLVQRRFAGNTTAQTALAEFEKDSETWERPLKKLLDEAGVSKDEEVVRQAEQVMRLVEPAAAAKGKYTVTIGEGTGVVIGDQARVDQTFGGAKKTSRKRRTS